MSDKNTTSEAQVEVYHMTRYYDSFGEYAVPGAIQVIKLSDHNTRIRELLEINRNNLATIEHQYKQNAENVAHWRQSRIDLQSKLDSNKELNRKLANHNDDYNTKIQSLEATIVGLQSQLKQKAENGCCVVEHGWRISAEHQVKVLEHKLERAEATIVELQTEITRLNAGLSIATDDARVKGNIYNKSMGRRSRS